MYALENAAYLATFQYDACVAKLIMLRLRASGDWQS